MNPHSSLIQPEWNTYLITENARFCVLCGQERSRYNWLCSTCEKHSEDSVLATCRDLIFTYGQTTYREAGKNNLKFEDVPSLLENGENDAEPAFEDSEEERICVAELSVSYLLDHFAVHFSTYVQPNYKKLMTAGAWFAHIMAYRAVEAELLKTIRPSPIEIIQFPSFFSIRESIFETMKEIIRHPEYYGCNQEERTTSEEALEYFFGNINSVNSLRGYFMKIITQFVDCGKLHLDLKLASDLKIDDRLKIIRYGGLKKGRPYFSSLPSSQSFYSKKSNR